MEITSRQVDTEQLRIQVYESGPPDGVPVLLIHGNLSTGRFFEPTMAAAPERYRMIAPDMRGFGRTERVPIDATRGLRDWAEDAASLLSALGIDGPVNLVGWSTGGAAIAACAIDQLGPVGSLTFIDPVSPYGFGATKGPDGAPTSSDFAGSGGGTGNPDFAQRLADGDRGTESQMSPLNVMRAFYWAPDHQMDPGWEQVLLEEVLLSETGDNGYPGDSSPSEHWPGFAPGSGGILNALSGKHCKWSDIVRLEPKPPVLWTHGTNDLVIADGSPWDIGSLGKMGIIPGWPGEEVHPPQPMVTQIRTVLERYRSAGGDVQTRMFDGSGHGPFIDAAEEWRSVFFGFLDDVT